MAWVRLATKTLTTAGTTIATDAFTSNKFNFDMRHSLYTGTSNPRKRVGKTTVDSSGTDTVSGNYATRRTEDGSGNNTLTLRNFMDNAAGGSLLSGQSDFTVCYSINISTQEKLFIEFQVNNYGGTGAGTAPFRYERVHKWANTTDQYDKVEFYNASNFDTDSNYVLIGSDGTPAVATWQNGLEFHETDTNKDYVWNSSTNAWIQIT